MKQTLNSNNGLLWILFLSGIFSCLMLFWLYQTKGNSYENHRAEKINVVVKNPISEKSNLSNDTNENLDNKLGCQLPKNISIDNAINNRIPFKKWLNSFKAEALANGISNETIVAAFKNVYPIQKVIDLDRRQKEYSLTFSKYLRNSISVKRIVHGKSMLKKYHTLLKNIEEKYGVQPQILISLWAMESNFGQNMGNFSTINTLATLAHEGRRHNFFRNELLCVLHILEEKYIHIDEMKSSWAGAMGQPQFMPSTFFYYSADGDADNKKNIWHNKADVLASAANYLNKLGWKSAQSWGLEVKLPKTFDPYQARFSEEKFLKEWYDLGVKKANGQQLSISNIKGSIILPSGIKGPAFLIFHNFRIIREWNKSMNYALTVGHLSDRLMGNKMLVGKAPKWEKPLTREQALSLQRNLKRLGLYKDKIDGMVGLKSRNAIREYQKSKGIPADAYPSPELILQIQKAR
ncbi:MAG: lytic murein transglycosylase [Thiomargarita sp.]|nr:lytic murein transglycosylase [Thiomargarita sp.]